MSDSELKIEMRLTDTEEDFQDCEKVLTGRTNLRNLMKDLLAQGDLTELQRRTLETMQRAWDEAAIRYVATYDKLEALCDEAAGPEPVDIE